MNTPFFVLFFLSVTALIPLALDYYVYRNWRRFVHYRVHTDRTPTLRWTLPVYRVTLVLMPLVAPLYFAFSNWYDVEPKLVRWAIMSLWGVYYAPKGLIAVGLAIKDGIYTIQWLFRWFQERLGVDDHGASAIPDATSQGASPDDVAHRADFPASAEQRLDLSDMRGRTRRDFLREVGWGAASVPFVMVGFSLFRTLYDFQVIRIDVPLSGLPRALDGLTIAQLSDIHAGSFFSQRPVHDVAATVRELQPDLITITGDYVNNDAAELDRIAPALQELHAELGVFGCLGNHDHYARVDDVRERLAQQTPIDLLVNTHRTLAIDGAQLHLIGTDNTGFNQNYGDLKAATDGMAVSEHGDDVQVLLAHVPTYWDERVRPDFPAIDLMLSGHTHGGQVGVEVGPVRWGLARIAYDRWAGLYHESAPGHPSRDGQWLYVNRGVGTVGPPLRMGIRPEITLLTLRRA